jgi:hypothetical protein
MNPYRDYFHDRRGFRGASARDKRLETKDSIFAFDFGGKKYAASHKVIKGGRVFELDGGVQVFLYRSKKAGIFESTAAFVTENGRIENKDGAWIETQTGARFDEQKGEFERTTMERLGGFDTFWYNWSLNNPETELLGEQST